MTSICVIGISEVASAWRINLSSAFLGGLRKIAPAVDVLRSALPNANLKFEVSYSYIFWSAICKADLSCILVDEEWTVIINNWKKPFRNFSMCNFRYILSILGLLKKTLSRVKVKDTMVTFLITSSKNVSQGIAAI